MSDVSGLAARRSAIALLRGVLDDRRTLADLTESAKGPLSNLGPEDRARATSLAAGTLRYLGRIDTLLGRFAKHMPTGDAANALRIAAFEILQDGIPAHAAVDSAVRLTSEARGGRKKAGFVNAIGRRLATEGEEIWPTLPAGGPGPWLGPALKAAYGKKALQAISRAHERGAPLDLTPRDPAQVETLASDLGGEILPTGSIRLARPGRISALPGFETGAWWVQDAAAAIPARLLGAVAGKKTLDLCAAPGGKTLQLASAGADVTALDLSDARLDRLRENLDRTGLDATIIAADALTYEPQEAFDIVVFDAPCSATGTLRRHPDLPHVRQEPDLKPLLALQSALLDKAVNWLKPGGRLLFCTCSLLPEEGEDQIAALLGRAEGLARLPIQPDNGIQADWLTQHGELRLRPDYWADRGGMDGFFVALLHREP